MHDLPSVSYAGYSTVQSGIVVEKVYLVTALMQNLSPAFTAICCKKIYIYIVATAGIKCIHFCSIYCN
jgi:hypothetical protein